MDENRDDSFLPSRGDMALLRAFRDAYGLASALALERGGLADKGSGDVSILELPGRFNARFAGRGWICTDSLSVPVMREALCLADAGKPEDADDVLAGFFDEATLRRCTVWRARRFYKTDARQEQIEEAINLYLEGRYWGALPLILIAADGIGADVTGRGIFGQDEDLASFDSGTGRHGGLRALILKIARARGETTADPVDLPYRHGILHGRDLGYATRVTCAKGWMLLVALVDWAVSRREETRRHDSPSFQDVVVGLSGNEAMRRTLDRWRPRSLSAPFVKPFGADGPEAAIDGFLASWRAGDHGAMGGIAINPTGKSDRKMAADISFAAKEVRLVGYEFLSLDQPTVAAASAQCRLEIAGFGHSLDSVFTVGATRVGPGGGVPMPSEPGRWQVGPGILWEARRGLRAMGLEARSGE